MADNSGPSQKLLLGAQMTAEFLGEDLLNNLRKENVIDSGLLKYSLY